MHTSTAQTGFTTSTEIARRLGISQGTVSRALAGNKRISLKVREQVQQLAKEMHYVSNAAARSLVKGKSNLVGILSSGLQVERTALELIALDDELHRHGYFPYFYYTRGETDRIVEGAHHLLGHVVDGLLILGVCHGAAHELQYRSLHQIRPTLFIDSPLVGNRVNSLHYDYGEAYAEVAARLRARGKRHVAALSSFVPLPGLDMRDDPICGGMLSVTDAFASGDCWLFLPRIGASVLEDVRAANRETVRAIAAFLDAHPACDALVCDEDKLAFCALSLLRERGKRVPEDVAVVGFGNDLLCDLTSPGLSSVGQRPNRLAEAVVRRLLECIDGGDQPPRVERIPGFLARRATL